MDYDYLKYKKILIVDDEADLREMVTSILEQDGFKTIKTAGTVAEALKICRDWEPDLAILDVMLPDGNGFSLFEQMRTFTEVPVLFLTARGEDEDKLKGLGLGADDYMVKPFLPKELSLRIGIILRRYYKGEDPIVQLAGSQIDFDRAEVIKENKHFPLTAKEHDILLALYRNAGRIVTIDQLCEAAWGDNPYGYENSLMAHIRRIREKIEANPSKPVSLITVKGLGYKLVLTGNDMKDITKLIRRFVGILLLSTVLVIVLNIIILAAISASQTANGRPWTTAKETAEALQKTETGYILSGDMTERLSGENAWAIYIDNDTLEVKWHTENLPDTVPLHYTISDIASLTRGYIDGYPTYTGECENGLVVVGYPKDRYWKHMSPSWDYDFIKNAPYTVLIVIGVNVFLIFLIYMIANSKLLKSVKPITNGIQALPSGEPVYVKEKGLLSDLAAKINQTSDILQKQKRNLQRKETARANWISGVSHDIRTPLSMVMGYAGQIEDNESLPESERKKARIIRQQSTKMKNLINDLNLASKLEYNMQPIHPEPVNLVAIARQSVVDFINLDMEEKYPIEWNTDEALTACAINGDKELLRRAIGNLITNSQTHNPDGCTISVCVRKSDTEYKIVVEDNGVGVTDEKLEKLRTTPHYMMSDSGTTEPRHGLGLLIVGQIVSAHKGTVSFDHGKQGGFTVTISFPIPKDSHTQ